MIDQENARLDQIFKSHEPPLHGDYCEERLSYIRGQTRVRGHLNEVGRTI
jgi:hypothetical protein